MKISNTSRFASTEQVIRENAVPPLKSPAALHLQYGQRASATVYSRTKEGNFILDMLGKRVTVQSALDFRVGQQLELQVTALTPQVQLQLLADHLKTKLNSSLPHLCSQNTLHQDITAIRRDADLFSSLSAASRQSLTQFLDLTSALTTASQQTGSTRASVVSLLSTVYAAIAKDVANASSGSGLSLSANTLPDSIAHIAPHLTLSSLQTSPSISPQAGESAVGQRPQFLSFLTTDAQQAIPAPVMLEILAEAAQRTGPVAEWIQNIAGLFKSQQTVFPTRQLADFLFSLLTKPLEVQDSTPQEKSGHILQQLTEKLGLQFEHLLLKGQTTEAASTLKSAAMELERLTAKESGQNIGANIRTTLESYQLLLGKLSMESVSLMPLPLPWLSQGFLLVDQETSQKKQPAEAEKKKRYCLHLKMEELGAVNIEILSHHNRVDILFKLEDTLRAQFLAEHKQELGARLTAAEIYSAVFLTGARDPAKTILSYLTENNTGMVNTQV